MNRRSFLFSATTTAAALALPAFAAPDTASGLFRPGEIWPDNNGVHINSHGGGLLLKDGVYYWYGEHKIKGSAGNFAQVGVACYSSRDLLHWKDEGIALAVAPADSKSDIRKGCILERPKVLFNAKTGKYVMWFHLEPKGAGYGGARSGVAVADKVTGPFTFIRSLRPNAGAWPKNYPAGLKEAPVPAKAKSRFSGSSLPGTPSELNIVKRDFEGGQMARDMTLFQDDDGTAYHIYSSEENSTLHIARLSDDFLSHTGEYVRVFEGRFMEAPAIFKHEWKYYLILSGCTGWAPNAGRSAVADNIWGPWTELKNPFVGKDSNTSFFSQSSYVQTVTGKNGKPLHIYIGDRWCPSNAIDGRYVWLPISMENGQPVIRWVPKWKLK